MNNTETYFTPDEAKKTLPLVKKIVEDILVEGKHLRELAEVIDGEIQDNPVVKARVAKLQTYLEELAEIGCYYRDWNFEFGLVDFPSVIDGEDVLLCWRSDEKDIAFYHTEEGGYSGRKPIPDEYFN